MRPNWIFETCDCCTREQRVAWSISDGLWTKVVIKHYRNKVLCLECFLRMADDRQVRIKLQDIQFVGVIGRYI